MLYRGRRYVNTCFVSVMRQLFKEHPQYPWSSNFLESKIFIDEAFPRGERKFPCIICTDVTDGEFFSTSFDRNFQEDVKDEYGNDYSNMHLRCSIIQGIHAVSSNLFCVETNNTIYEFESEE